jgi:hypothetical protein
LKVILSAAGVAALLASPAMAKTVRHQHAAPSTVYCGILGDPITLTPPINAHGFVGPYGYVPGEGRPYTPRNAHGFVGPQRI